MKTMELAHALAGETIAYRRTIHQHPESSMREFETTARICAELDKLGVSYRKTEPTGVIAEIRGTAGESDRIVMLRGDIDALEITEDTGLPFASQNPGIMHACGHDAHSAMLMGAVKVIQQMRGEFAGTVRFCFQPAEEVAQGAKWMIAQGVMEGVDYAFGLHIQSGMPSGIVFSMPGAFYASTSRFVIKVTGKSSHGAEPANGIDAAVAGCAVVTALQTLVSREYPPSEPLVVTVGQIHSGTRFNIIPGYCEIEGTTRTYSREICRTLPEAMTRVAKSVAAGYRCDAEVTFETITEVTFVDPEAMEIGKAAMEKVAPGRFRLGTPTMGGEDFCFYSVSPEKKCAYFQLGAAVADPEKQYPLHSEHVLFDEDALEYGVAFYAQTALDALEKLNG